MNTNSHTPKLSRRTPLFIGGMMKSGTTLMRAIISNHSKIFGGLETWWFSENFINDYRDSDSKTSEKLRFFYHLEISEYEEIVSGSDSYQEFLDKLMSYLAEKEGKYFWVEKTPDNILHIPQIQEFWQDEFVFIHMLRNPLDIFASWKKNTDYTLDYFLEKIGNTEAVLQSEEYINFPNKVHVSYSQLVHHPGVTTEAILSRIGEQWEEGMEATGKGKQEYDMVKKFANKHSTTLASLSKPIFTSSIDQYKEVLTKGEIESIINNCAVYIETLAKIKDKNVLGSGNLN